MDWLASNGMELNVKAKVCLAHDGYGLVHSARSCSCLPFACDNSLDEFLFVLQLICGAVGVNGSKS